MQKIEWVLSEALKMNQRKNEAMKNERIFQLLDDVDGVERVLKIAMKMLDQCTEKIVELSEVKK